MKVSPMVFVGINVLVLLLVIFIITVLGWLILNSDGATNDAKIKADFVRLEASSQIYYSRLGFYNGVCSDIGLSKDYTCHDSENAFAVEANSSPGRFYCFDSTGFSGKTLESKGAGLRCRH